MIVSLFSGLGGLDLGFENAGFSVGAAYEIRAESVRTYNHNRPGNPIALVADIRDLAASTVSHALGGPCSGLIGGPPCQSFTQANRSKIENDPRSEMLSEFARILEGLNSISPVPFFVIENVPELCRVPHLDRLIAIEERCRVLGFAVSKSLLNAVDFATPQKRHRLFIVGINQRLLPGITWIPPAPMPRHRTVREAIAGLPDPAMFSVGADSKTFPAHSNHWCMRPKSHRFHLPGYLRPGDSSKRSFKVLAWDRPSLAVAYGHREVHVHPDCHRRLSVYEAMLLQGFPSTFEVQGSMSSQITQVSEAVPPPLAKAVAESISILFAKTPLARAA